jgi:hypothetical protein
MGTSDNIRVFISYSHDSKEHKERVLRLAKRLESNGIDCNWDGYLMSPPEGWPRWMRKQIRQADFVLVICTKTYQERYEGEAEFGTGAGAKWEGMIITQEIYEAEGRNNKFIPVTFSKEDSKHIPIELRSGTRYVLDDDEGYLEMYARITNQPWVQKGTLGERLILPPVEIVTNVDTSETSIAESLRLSCDVTNRETNIALVNNISGVSTTGIALGRKADSTRALFTLPGTHRKNPYFTPKHEVAAALSSLCAGDTLVLCGPPGVGKTQHAVQHAQERHHQYSMVLWASADSAQSLHQALASLADLVLPIAETSCSTEEKVVALRKWLETEPEWLLILDNADSDEIAREIERFIPAAHRGYVLVTSQIADWTPAFRIERVDVWTVAQSSEFLAQRLARCAADKVNLARLGSELGGLPLALEHAGAYIAATGISAGEYLELLSRDRKGIFGRRHLGMTDYRASIAATWQLAVRRLGWLARQILHYAACLASEPIPRSILSHLLPSASKDITYSRFERRQFRRAARPPDALNLALAELARYSLVTLSEESFRLHPLLQHVVLDSSRLRPWQARYWLCRMQGIGRSDWSLAAGLWLCRTAYLLNLEGVLPIEFDNDAASLKMRPFIAHLQILSRNIAAIVPEKSGFSLNVHNLGVGRLNHTLRWFEERINWYQSGMSVLRELLESNAKGSPHLTAETEWFLAHVEELYKQVVGTSSGHNLAHILRWLSGDGKWDTRQESYHFLNILSRAHAESGDPATARRLFRFYIAHAMSDPEAPGGEVAYARLHEALSMIKHLPLDELQNLLESALVLYEGGMERLNPDVWNAVWFYARISTTPERQSRALGWIRQVLPQARKYLPHRIDHACRLTEEYIRLLGDDDESDEALLTCEETLRLALKSRELRRNSVTGLWLLRGRLLLSRQRFMASARSYARCLALKLQYDKPPPFQQIDLHFVIGVMYLRAEAIPAAKMHLLNAHDLLETHWSDDPQEAEYYANVVGLALGQAHEEAKGEALLRRALARPQED